MTDFNFNSIDELKYFFVVLLNDEEDDDNKNNKKCKNNNDNDMVNYQHHHAIKILNYEKCMKATRTETKHDDVMARKRFPHYWRSVMGIHRSPMDFPHKAQQTAERKVNWHVLTLIIYRCN